MLPTSLHPHLHSTPGLQANPRSTASSRCASLQRPTTVSTGTPTRPCTTEKKHCKPCRKLRVGGIRFTRSAPRVPRSALACALSEGWGRVREHKAALSNPLISNSLPTAHPSQGARPVPDRRLQGGWLAACRGTPGSDYFHLAQQVPLRAQPGELHTLTVATLTIAHSPALTPHLCVLKLRTHARAEGVC